MNTEDKPIRIIEVIGPAGAGKSTIGQILCQTKQVEWIRSAPYFRRVKDLPFFSINTLLMLRTLLLLYINNNGRWFTPEEIAWMVILNGWCRRLKRSARISESIYFVDEGPIFHLAYLFMRGPEVLQTSWADPWWRKMHKQVVNATDIVVWLDANNEVLLERIRTRKKYHLFQNATDEQVCLFLDNLRRSYSCLMSNFVKQKNDLKVLIFDTEKATIDEISGQIFASVKENLK